MNAKPAVTTRDGAYCRVIGGTRLLALSAAALGCAAAVTPRRMDLTSAPRVLPVRQEVEVWEGPRARTLHGVRIAPDTVSGVPILQSPGCDSCRITYRMASVDSLMLGDVERSWLTIIALPVAVLGGLLLAWNLSDAD